MRETIWRNPLGRRAGRSIPHVIDAHREFCVCIPWYLLSSMLRAAFGVIILMLGTRLYGKTTREILSLHNSKIAM